MARKKNTSKTNEPEAETPQDDTLPATEGGAPEATPIADEAVPPSDVIEDAEVVSVDGHDAQADPTVPDAEATDADAVSEGAPEASADAVTADESPADEVPAGGAPSDEVTLADGAGTVVIPPQGEEPTASADPVEDRDAKQAQAPLPVTAPPPPAKSGPGFLPLVLGGLIAGGIGYGVATLTETPPPPPAEIDMSRVDALEAQIAALTPADVDLTGVEGAQADLSARIDALAARLDAVEGRDIANAQTQAASASTADIASEATETLRAELVALSDDLAALRQDVDGLPRVDAELADRVAAVEAGLQDMSVEAASIEASAEDLARDAARNQMRLAVDTGQPFTEQVDLLGDVPPALSDMAEGGVPTTSALASDFPAVARAALRAARSVTPDDGNPLTAFLRRQTGARSLEPREGDDPDAVLSRAEAAVRMGDIDAALAEIETLPPEAQNALSAWTDRARARAGATAALQDYFETE
ncbi:COG4223 family protein [Jannaschia sp. M317]|uniref:COG4223 family protein n=1 Tax=Jannaschia sp. M317 TaxID=2867011 RepID=UPI0021A5C478|nr:hypothetical protein [Jannaschia sp. M317]UWQ17772.1 hypothetical protein K3551_00160 [Jannaschia sp. M317]